MLMMVVEVGRWLHPHRPPPPRGMCDPAVKSHHNMNMKAHNTCMREGARLYAAAQSRNPWLSMHRTGAPSHLSSPLPVPLPVPSPRELWKTSKTPRIMRSNASSTLRCVFSICSAKSS